MTLKDAILRLQELAEEFGENAEVIVSEDAEGNGFSSLDEITQENNIELERQKNRVVENGIVLWRV